MVIKPCKTVYKELLKQDYNFAFAEQDVLNILFKNKIKHIDSKYNYLNHLPIVHPEVCQDFSVFHFGYGKPWIKNNTLKTHQEMYDIWCNIAH
jgi:lipopolysaccharide biosynthesis glycosyltransferase